MPPKYPELSDDHKSQLNASTTYSQQVIEAKKKENAEKDPHNFKHGHGLHHKIKKDITKGDHRPNSPIPSPKTTRRVGSGSGSGSGDGGADETGYDGAKESEGKSGGEGKKKDKEQPLVPTTGHFSQGLGGAGMTSKMKDRLRREKD